MKYTKNNAGETSTKYKVAKSVVCGADTLSVLEVDGTKLYLTIACQEKLFILG